MNDPRRFAGNPASNYEQYFVPTIGAPVAARLLERIRIGPSDDVLDVGCGTGVVTRLVRERLGPDGSVTGIDMNPGMISVARSLTAQTPPIAWREQDAGNLEFEDESFDTVVSQMSLPFFEDKSSSLNEMWRILKPHGRLALNVPGRIPVLFEAMANALAEHVKPELAGFVQAVFSLNDPGELERLIVGSGFDNIEISSEMLTLNLPPTEEFLWQYIYSTPLAAGIAGADDEQLRVVEEDVRKDWFPFERNGGLTYEQEIVFAYATKTAT